jgi:hypothetical protein
MTKEVELISAAHICLSRWTPYSKMPTGWRLRRLLPYGIWSIADGREALFDRHYRGICERRPGERATVIWPRVWIEYTSENTFYHDGTPERHKRKIAVEKLHEWGVYDEVLACVREHITPALS